MLLRDGQVTALNATHPAPPLGLGELTTPQYQVVTYALEPADLLLLYTDGVIEARAPGRVFHPLAERAASQAHDSPQALIHHLRADLLAHAGGRLGDDAAMVCNSHQPTRQRERAMKGFRSTGGAQRFLSAFSGISPHLRPRRHLMTATEYRTEMTTSFATWDEITGSTDQPIAA